MTPINGQPAEVNGLTSSVNSMSLTNTEDIKEEEGKEVGRGEEEEGHVTPTPESADIIEENHINGTDTRQLLGRNHNYQVQQN